MSRNRAVFRTTLARRGPRARSAFTLVELLISIAIVAVLGAIAVPIYSSYRERALVAQAMSDIRSMEAPIARYQSDNGVLPNSLADIRKNSLLDPWGRPYRYTNLTTAGKKSLASIARKDKNLVPINTDFDLYSVGKDGLSSLALTAAASHDDVIRANNGRFVGLASTY